MIFRLRIGRWRFTFTMAPVVDVVGVNSLLPNGNHILLWDFDHTTQGYVENTLIHIQYTYALPRIYVFQTKKDENFIAYCFYQCSWRRCIEIIATTKGVDKYYFKYGVYREHFTIRVTPKEGRNIKLVKILESSVPENATIKELRSWTKYETLSDQANTRKVELNIAKST